MPTGISFSVIIPAYTLERWDLLVRAVESVSRQEFQPCELILAIDDNHELVEQCRRTWNDEEASRLSLQPLVVDCSSGEDQFERNLHSQVHGTVRRFGAGAARNMAAALATGDVLAFMDDDAEADADWLAWQSTHFERGETVAVGGRPIPRYETRRPPWIPDEYDWVFGCAYRGLPESAAPARHLIGASLSCRRDSFERIGGFHSIDFDDMDLCHRLAATFGPNTLIYEPNAIVHHYVPAARVSWNYFWRRCFYVNRYKVLAFNEMGDAANLAAELSFALRLLKRRSRDVVRGIAKRDRLLLLQAFVAALGLILAGAGHVTGQIENFWLGKVGRHLPSQKDGLSMGEKP
jgi:GT2 family glycosyltransferase